MKRILLTLATGLVSCSLLGQGGIVFVTRGGGVDARVVECRAGGQGLEGTNYLAQLYYGRVGESGMKPVLNAPAERGGTNAPPAWFGTGTIAGYILGSTGGGYRYTDSRIVAPGALTAFQLRVWEASNGRTWEEAIVNYNGITRILGNSLIFTASTSTSPLDTAKPLTGLSSFCADILYVGDTIPPVVAIGSPINGQDVLTTDITVNGTAYDPPSFPMEPTTGVSLVEVRVNGGEWHRATGREDWSCAARLAFGTNLIEARCRDGFIVLPEMQINYSAIESVTVSLLNHPPTTPANLWPPDGETNQAVAPILQADGFTDLDEGDTHAASQWLMRRVSDGVTVFDSGEDAVNMTSLAVPAGVLDYGTRYDWQVRFKDNRGAWSDYSAAMLSTLAPSLRATLQGSTLFVAWPTNTVGFGLEFATNLPGTNWSPASPVPVVVGEQKVVTNTLTGGTRFYRLKKP